MGNSQCTGATTLWAASPLPRSSVTSVSSACLFLCSSRLSSSYCSAQQEWLKGSVKAN